MLKMGIYTQRRDRVFDSRQFVYGPLSKIIYSQKDPEIDLAENKISEIPKKKILFIEKSLLFVKNSR